MWEFIQSPLKVSSFVVIGLGILLPIVAPLFSQFSATRDNELTEALFRTVTKWLCYSALMYIHLHRNFST